MTGLEAEELAADLEAFVPGRQVDDNAHVLLSFRGGANGMLWSSQVSPGNENALRFRVYGETGGLEWAQARRVSPRRSRGAGRQTAGSCPVSLAGRAQQVPCTRRLNSGNHRRRAPILARRPFNDDLRYFK